MLLNQNKVVDAKSINASLISIKKQIDINKKTIAATEEKLKNINIGGGGSIDAYTKSESDSRFAPINHNHDTRYYTKGESDNLLSDKQNKLVSGTNIKTINSTSLLGSGNISVAPSIHNHDDRYYTESETNTLLDNKFNVSGGTFSGPLSFNSSSLPSKNLDYITGIDAFASGGQLGWQSKSDFLSGKQDTLTSGTNIKTINGNSILGGGDLTVGGDLSIVKSTDYTTEGMYISDGGIWKIGNNLVWVSIKFTQTTTTSNINLGNSIKPSSRGLQYLNVKEWDGNGIDYCRAYIMDNGTFFINAQRGYFYTLIGLYVI